MASNLLSNKHSESQYRENYVESYKRRDGGAGGVVVRPEWSTRPLWVSESEMFCVCEISVPDSQGGAARNVILSPAATETWRVPGTKQQQTHGVETSY